MRESHTYTDTINGQVVTVRRFTPVVHRTISLTKPRHQSKKGREAGGRFLAKERE